MHKISISPLSVNRCWQGKRFKTKEYETYEEVLNMLLPRAIDIAPEGKLKLTIFFGVSSKLADIDNPVKPFQDILQKRYGFNDRRIYRLEIEKVDVPKGQEFIEWQLSPHGE